MNQISYFTLEADINGMPYRLSLPVGAKWAEAIAGVEQMMEKIKEIAEIAQKNHAATQPVAEDPSTEPVEVAAEATHECQK